MAVVLILTNSNDGIHTDDVIERLTAQGSTVIRLDTDKVSRGDHLLSWDLAGISLKTPTATHNLLNVDSVWFRRPRVFDFAVQSPVQKAHTEKEFQALLEGIYATLASKRWLNTPQALNNARLKAYQLRVAAEQDLMVPQSIITADPEVAKQFCAQGPVVFKPLVESNIRGDGEKMLLIPTTLLTKRHIERLALIRNQYILLQRYIEKRYELRITFVDGELFVAKQTPSANLSAIPTDWRLLQINGKSTYEPSRVSEDLERKITGLMQKLDLNFATLDFAVDFQGRHFFLEVNPNGQWFGYADDIGLPAAAAIARFLARPSL